MKEPAILFIESNTSGTGRMFLQSASDLGFAPILLSAKPSRYEFGADDLTHAISCDTSSVEEILRTCERLAERFVIKAVWSSSEYYIATSAVVAASLDLPGPNPSAVARCRDKNSQRQLTASLHDAAPRSVLAKTTKSIHEAVADIGLPVVLKPVSGSGSVGVRLCALAGEVGRVAEEICDDLLQQKLEPTLLVEEYIDGAEYSVEIFDGRSVGVTRKHLGALPFFVEVGHDFPAQDGTDSAPTVSAFAERVASALDITWGPAHIELKIRNGVPALVEANPRLAGGFIPVLVRHSAGIDLIEVTLRRALGWEVDLRPTKRCGASIRFLLRDQRAEEPSKDRISYVLRQRHVVDICLYSSAATPGRELQGDFRDRIGHIITVGRDVEEATRAADEAVNGLQGYFEGVR
ncbi:ATP-grasp domain-containing protein [Rhizobium leguminosarum]|uniref:ATP-grasp domain-containing protein n=1 Tax=Rhizobium leguminosarum TaxID=384 RepID=UPI003F950E8B